MPQIPEGTLPDVPPKGVRTNVTRHIYSELKERLLAGVYPEGSKFPAEMLLANEFGVSKITMNKIVSMLAGEGFLLRGVRGAGTRVAARGIIPSGNIGCVFKLNPFSLKILKGVQQECLRNGILPVVYSPEADELQFVLDTFHKNLVKGVISIGYGLLVPAPGVDFVCIDCTQPRNTAAAGVRFIDSDSYAGGRMMMEEIIKRRHRDIVIFSAERFVFSSAAPLTPRIRGFMDVLNESGIDASRRIFYASPDPADAENALRMILAAYPGVTAVCCDSDHAAELLFHVSERSGVRKKYDFTITGFGNISALPIASVDQSPEQQGRRAVRKLLAPGLQEREELVGVSLVNAECIPILS